MRGAATTRKRSLDEVARALGAVAVSPHLLSLVNAGDANDPIARQFLPGIDELVTLLHPRRQDRQRNPRRRAGAGG